MTSRQPRGWQEIHPRGGEADAFRLAAILESSPDAIIAWSLDGELTDWNPGAERLLGYTREEAVGMPVSALWKPEVRATLEYTVSRFAGARDVARIETEHLRMDGGTVDVSVTISAVRDSHGRVIEIGAILRDVSGQKRSERLLAEERTRWVAELDGCQSSPRPAARARPGESGERRSSVTDASRGPRFRLR
jgi:PAS domain S-box-containing protein